METSLYFAEFVLTMCIVHLAWTASAQISTWWNEKVLLSKKSTAIAENCNGIFQKAQTAQRSDWYAFFHCSDLVGRDPLQQENVAVKQNRTAQFPASTSSTDDLRNSSRRPRARLTLS